MPELAKRCIESWRQYCPDYEIKRWDESNFDLNYNDYVREAYKAKKWAFVTDVVRLYALVNYGGIYMDTDVEVIKSLDELLEYEAVSGFESEQRISTGIMASTKGHELFDELLNDYEGVHFIRPDGTYDTTTNVIRITNICLKYGFVPNNTLQTVKGCTLLPDYYLCPKDPKTWELNITEHTLTIHHFDGSWLSDAERKAKELAYKYKGLAPSNVLKFIGMVRYGGIKEAVKKVKGVIRENE